MSNFVVLFKFTSKIAKTKVYSFKDDILLKDKIIENFFDFNYLCLKYSLEKVNKFFKEMKEKYHLTELGVSYQFSNGETGYHKIIENYHKY